MIHGIRWDRDWRSEHSSSQTTESPGVLLQLWVPRSAQGGEDSGQKNLSPSCLPLSILWEHSPVSPVYTPPSCAACSLLHPVFPDQHRLLGMEPEQHFPGVLSPSWSWGSALT